MAAITIIIRPSSSSSPPLGEFLSERFFVMRCISTRERDNHCSSSGVYIGAVLFVRARAADVCVECERAPVFSPSYKYLCGF